MNKPDNGGPAFPQWDGHAITSEPMYLRGGMSLRDYFAGQFMVGYLAQDGYGGWGSVSRQDGLAIMAYDMADTMLKRRAYPAPPTEATPKDHV